MFWLRKLLIEEDISVLHSSMSYGAIFGSFASAFTSVKHVWFQHGPVSSSYDLFAHLLPHASCIFNSQFTLSEQVELLRKCFYFRKLKTPRIIKLGANQKQIKESLSKIPSLLDERYNQRNEMGFRNDDFVFSMFTRMQNWKGIHLFVDAVLELNKNNPIVKGWLFTNHPSKEKDIKYFEEIKK